MHLVIVMGKSDWCGGLSDKTSFSVWHLKTWCKQCPVCGTTWEGLGGVASLMEVCHQGQTLKISSPRPSPSVCSLCFLLFLSPNSATWESSALACWPLSECSSLPFYILSPSPYLIESPLSHPGLSEWSLWFCAIPLPLSRSPFRWGHFSSSSSLSSSLDFSSFMDAPCRRTPIPTFLFFFLLQMWMALALCFQCGASHQAPQSLYSVLLSLCGLPSPSSWNAAPWLLRGTAFPW